MYNFAFRNDGEGNKICGTCYNKGISIHDYGYKPPSMIRKSRKNPKLEKDTLLFGVELEVENLRKNKAIQTPRIAMAHRFLLEMGRDIWYLKTDGSLTDGIEVVSHPFSWQKFKEDKPKWEKIFTLFDKNKWGATDNCGIHIHMSKAAFTTLHLYKFIKFIYEINNRDFMLAIAQRSGKQCHDYCRFYEEDEDKMGTTAKKKENASGERHSAVSLLYEPTAEIRIFQSTIVPLWFYKNLEFAKSLFEFSKSNTVKDMVAYKYILYVMQNANKYQNLLQFVRDNEHINHHYPVIQNVLKKGA
jgi:hypothetical protein